MEIHGSWGHFVLERCVAITYMCYSEMPRLLVYMHACMNTYKYARIYVCTCVCACAFVRVRVFGCVQKHGLSTNNACKKTPTSIWQAVQTMHIRTCTHNILHISILTHFAYIHTHMCPLWLMLLFSFHNELSSSFAGCFICSNIRAFLQALIYIYRHKYIYIYQNMYKSTLMPTHTHGSSGRAAGWGQPNVHIFMWLLYESEK